MNTEVPKDRIIDADTGQALMNKYRPIPLGALQDILLKHLTPAEFAEANQLAIKMFAVMKDSDVLVGLAACMSYVYPILNDVLDFKVIPIQRPNPNSKMN